MDDIGSHPGGLENTPSVAADVGTSAADLELTFASYRDTGSTELAELVYRIAAPRLRIYAGTILEDPNDIDDIVQDAMLAALDRPENWDSTRPLLPWLAGIVHNLTARRRRTERRRKLRESSCRIGVDTPADPAVTTAAGDLFDLVERRIGGLPGCYREVVAGRLLRGATAVELAQELQRPESTVRVQLHRGMRMLRDALPMGIGAAVAFALIPGTARAAPAFTGNAGDERSYVRRADGTRWLRRGMLAAAAAALPLVAWLAYPPARAPIPAVGEPEQLVAGSPGEEADSGTGFALQAAAERAAVVRSPHPAVELLLLLDGQPAAGAPVSVEPIGDRRVFTSLISDAHGPRRDAEVMGPDLADRVVRRSSAEGTVRFELDPGRYLIRVPGDGATVEVRDDVLRYHIDLSTHAAAVSGEVVDASGMPCAAEIWSAGASYDSPLTTLLTTDEHGRFSGVFERGAVLQARLEDAVSPSVRVTVGQPTVRLTLARAVCLEGLVRGPDGRPQAGAVVELSDGDSPSRVRSDAEGRFTIVGVGRGAFRIAARSAHAPVTYAESSVRIDRDRPDRVILDLQQTAAVTGRVTDAMGRPIVEALVRSGWSPNRLRSASASSDADGWFTLAGVPPGVTRVHAEDGEGGVAHARVSLVAGQTYRWNPVLMQSSLRVAGRIENAPPGCQLVVGFDTDDHLRPVFAEVSDGTFCTELPPSAAEYQLRARVFRADTLERLGLHAAFPIVVCCGLTAGDQNVVIQLPDSPDPRGEVRARVVAPRPGYVGTVRLVHCELGHWIELGRFDGHERYLDVRAERLPAGSYRLFLQGIFAPVEFTMTADQRLELGDLAYAPNENRLLPTTTVRLVFRHPGDATPMDRLRICAVSANGSRRNLGEVPGQDGSWLAQLELTPGPVTIVASTGNGMHAQAEIVVPESGDWRFELPLESPRVR